MEDTNDLFSLYRLDWDSQFFGIECAKIILHRTLDITNWLSIIESCRSYEFITIVNQDSDPENSYLIGSETKAFLADVNIQFKKKVTSVQLLDKKISVCRNMEPVEELFQLADYRFSRFVSDKRLFNLGGSQIYINWLKNAFRKKDKYFAISYSNDKIQNGFVLYSFSDNKCIIELIAVSDNCRNSGIGTKLVQTVEYEAGQRNCDVIQVGTQLRNIEAINFYHKAGFRQVECNQIYHLWN